MLKGLATLAPHLGHLSLLNKRIVTAMLAMAPTSDHGVLPPTTAEEAIPKGMTPNPMMQYFAVIVIHEALVTPP